MPGRGSDDATGRSGADPGERAAGSVPSTERRRTLWRTGRARITCGVARRNWGGGNLDLKRTLILATWLIAGAATAHAQTTRGDSTTRFHVLPALGLQVGSPQRASAALGIVVG